LERLSFGASPLTNAATIFKQPIYLLGMDVALYRRKPFLSQTRYRRSKISEYGAISQAPRLENQVRA
jgi:hypothetical protein